MQSGKFFSDETLRDLGVLNEDTSQNLTTGESQIDEAPLGFAAGLGQRALATFGIGQSTRAAAKGKLEVGKIANQMYSSYYKWLQTQTPATPSKDNILAFLQSRGIPTANASKILTQAETDNMSKVQNQAERENEKRDRDASKKMSNLQSQAERENEKRDQKDKFTKPMKNPPFSTPPVRGVTEWKELNDILKLSGLPEVMIEALSNDQISKAFTAASGDYISNQQAATQAASPQDTATPPAAATQAASPQDKTSEKSTAPRVGGGPPPETLNIVGNNQNLGTTNFTKLSRDPLTDIDTWIQLVNESYRYTSAQKTKLFEEAKTKFENALNSSTAK